MFSELKVLVLPKSKAKIKNVNDYVSNLENPQIMLVFSSLHDEIISANFFSSLIEESSLPFMGVRSSGVISSEGFSEDSVAVAVLCGDISYKLVVEKLDYDNIQETTQAVLRRLSGGDACIVLSASNIRKCLKVNDVLRETHHAFPKMVLWGGASVSPHVVVTREGIFEDTIAFLEINGVTADFHMGAGFTFKEGSKEYKITRCDSNHVYEIDGEKAPEEYSRLQHMRPYMLNTISNIVTRHDVTKTYEKLSHVNKNMSESILRTIAKFLGVKHPNGVIEAWSINYIDDDFLQPSVYLPEGTPLKWVESTPHSQQAVYDLVVERFQASKGVLVSSCLLRQFYINFEYDKVWEKIAQLSRPFLIIYLAGEIGAYPGEETDAIHHSCSIQVLGVG